MWSKNKRKNRKFAKLQLGANATTVYILVKMVKLVAWAGHVSIGFPIVLYVSSGQRNILQLQRNAYRRETTRSTKTMDDRQRIFA